MDEHIHVNKRRSPEVRDLGDGSLSGESSKGIFRSPVTSF